MGLLCLVRSINLVRGIKLEETGIGERIKTLRKAIGMLQSELADALGVSTNIISKWENGLARPSRGDNISKLSEALGVSPTTLMFGNMIPTTDNSLSIAERFEMLNVENKELVGMIIDHQLEKQQKTLNQEDCSE
jgi:transcriptional regulator with XRE-family HTH domain